MDNSFDDIDDIDNILKDTSYFSITFNKIPIVADVLLHIISLLDNSDIIVLSRVCKSLYGLCNSNYIWGPRLFSKECIPEKTLEIIYNNNKRHFLSYYYFKHYVTINYQLNGNPDNYHYLDLFRNIIALISHLRSPYFHTDIKTIYMKMLKENIVYDEVIYIAKAVTSLDKYTCPTIWEFREKTKECDILIQITRCKNNRIKFKKLVVPFNVPSNIIGKVKIILYAETINRLFNI